MHDGFIFPSVEVQAEVQYGDQHEDHSDGFNRRAIKVAKRCVMGRETANRDGCKTVPYGIEERHTGKPISGRAGNGQR